MEKTLVLIKPDAIQRGLVGQIITRYEQKGLILVGMKMIQLDDRVLDEHYSHLNGKSFFPRIKEFMKSTPVIVSCWTGVDAVQTVRKTTGTTLSRDANPGTVRGDFGMSVQANLIHASDTLENAIVELERFFSKDEIFTFVHSNLDNLYSWDELGR